MQDELKKVISQAMNTSSNFEQESIGQFEELSDEDLEAVAGGVCVSGSRHYAEVKKLWTSICYKNANKLV